MKDKQKMMGWEVLEEYKKGRRDSSNISISIGEFAGADLSGAIFRNCKIEDATFRGAKLVDADFSGSEIIFTGFNDADLTRAKFNNCYIKWVTFDRTIFDDTEMKNSEIVWCGFLNTNIACIDFSNSRQYKVVTGLSQLTEADIKASVIELGAFIDKLDFERRLHMRVIANRVMEDYGFSKQLIPAETGIIDNKKYGNVNVGLYTKILSSIIEESISAYKQEHPYKQKSPYVDKRDKKKSSYGGK